MAITSKDAFGNKLLMQKRNQTPPNNCIAFNMVTDKNKANVKIVLEALTSCLKETKLAAAAKSVSAKVNLSGNTAMSVTSVPDAAYAVVITTI